MNTRKLLRDIALTTLVTFFSVTLNLTFTLDLESIVSSPESGVASMSASSPVLFVMPLNLMLIEHTKYVGPSLLRVRWPGTHCQTASEIRHCQPTLSDVI